MVLNPFREPFSPNAIAGENSTASKRSLSTDAPSGVKPDVVPAGIDKTTIDTLAALYHTFTSLGGVVTMLACLFDIAANDKKSIAALPGLTPHVLARNVEQGLSRTCSNCNCRFRPSAVAVQHAQARSNLVLICFTCNLRRRGVQQAGVQSALPGHSQPCGLRGGARSVAWRGSEGRWDSRRRPLKEAQKPPAHCRKLKRRVEKQLHHRAQPRPLR